MKTQDKFTIALVFVTVLFGAAVTLAQNIKVGENQTQLLVAATQTGTLQKELDQAGAKGFHILYGTTRGNSEVVLLLERNLNAGEQHQFKVVATNATKTFDKEVSELAAGGYRAIGSTFMNKPGFIGIGSEILVVMERPAKPTRFYAYKLLAASQTSTMESEWRANNQEGYKAVGMLTRNEVMVLLEREAKPEKR